MTSTFPKNSVLFAAAAMALAPAATLIFLAPGASAQTSTKSAVVQVYVGDLETGRDGVGQVSKRLEAAARSVCGAIATHSPLVPREQADCVRASVADALNRIADQREAIVGGPRSVMEAKRIG